MRRRARQRNRALPNVCIFHAADGFNKKAPVTSAVKARKGNLLRDSIL